MFRKIIIGLAICLTLLIVLSAVFAFLGIEVNPTVLSSVVIFGGLGYYLWNGYREAHHINDTHMPNQVVALIEQAHRNAEFRTTPPIYVSDEMRQKLMYPLNPTLAQIIGATEYPVTENEFVYDIISREWINSELHLSVKVNIDYCDTAKNIDVHFRDVIMRIVLGGKPQRHGCEIISVDHN